MLEDCGGAGANPWRQCTRQGTPWTSRQSITMLTTEVTVLITAKPCCPHSARFPLSSILYYQHDKLFVNAHYSLCNNFRHSYLACTHNLGSSYLPEWRPYSKGSIFKLAICILTYITSKLTSRTTICSAGGCKMKPLLTYVYMLIYTSYSSRLKAVFHVVYY